MRTTDRTLKFGDWMPDQPDIEVSRVSGLTDAKNVRPIDSSYKPYTALSALSVTAPGTPIGAIYPSQRAGSTWSDDLYVGFSGSLYVYDSGSGWVDKSGATYTAATYWSFAQFDEIVIGTNDADKPQQHTIGAAGTFADLDVAGTAPVASAIGTVGRFVVLGDLEASGGIEREHNIQWCAIDDPTDWPTPGSADAQSKQAGLQELNKSFGSVTGIHGGDQYGIILQQGGLTRMTYIGGDEVFQFDEFSKTHGCICPNASIMVNDVVYFPSQSGFVATDGARITPIGENRVDRWFFDLFDTQYRNKVYVAHDARNRLIVWTFPSTGATAGRPDYLLFFSYADNRWAYAVEDTEVLHSSPNGVPVPTIYAFNSVNAWCGFSGSVGVATITTGEAELNPGGRTMIQGIKPLVQWPTGVTVDVTVALGTRNDQDVDSISFGANSTPHTRTGVAGFRSDARFHRASFTITGNFETAFGYEVQAKPSGAT